MPIIINQFINVVFYAKNQLYIKKNTQQIGASAAPSRSMLVFAKDQQWKNIRTILAPTFSSGKLKKVKDCK